MPDDLGMGVYARSVIFGTKGITPALSLDFKPIQQNEMSGGSSRHQAYANSFSAKRRSSVRSLMPFTCRGNFNFSNLDRWYERDAGERVGDYTLYQLKLRN